MLSMRRYGEWRSRVRALLDEMLEAGASHDQVMQMLIALEADLIGEKHAKTMRRAKR